MILFLDTSTEKCRVWLDGKYFEKELGREMSKKALSFIKESLRSEGLRFQDLSAIGVFAGPGSFTGLRIGITIANTLADSLQIPIVSAKNPEDLKISDEQNIDEWIKIAKDRISKGKNDRIVMPFYGREANITKPRK